MRNLHLHSNLKNGITDNLKHLARLLHNQTGAYHLLLVLVVSAVITLIMTGLLIISLIQTTQAATLRSSLESFFAAEGILYETMEHKRRDPNWPSTYPNIQNYTLGAVQIRRVIEKSVSGKDNIEVTAESKGSRRKLKAGYSGSSSAGKPPDVALVIDRSSSMDKADKFPSAQAAAIALIDYLNPSTDQVGVIFFDRHAINGLPPSEDFNHQLTFDHTAVQLNIQNADTGHDTNILDGLYEGRRELQSVRIRPDDVSSKVMVFLSDGRPDNLPSNSPCTTGSINTKILCEADISKSAGILIYSIGLGSDVDAALMQSIASVPSMYYFAPDASQLQQIFEEIGGLIVSGETFEITEQEPGVEVIP